jgi:hypothetical protein
MNSWWRNINENCYDDIITSLLRYWGEDESLFYLSSFYTHYVSKDDVGISVMRSNEWLQDYVLKNIYGVHKTFVAYSERKLCDTMKCKNTKAVCVVVDPYDCYWTPFYNQSHFEHVCLVVEVNLKEQFCVVIDSYCEENNQIKLRFMELDLMVKNLVIFEYKHQEANHRPSNYLSVLDKVLRHNLTEIKDEARHLKECLLRFVSTQKEQSNYRTQPYLITLNWFYNDKIHFASVLSKLDMLHFSGQFIQACELLLEAARTIEIVKNSLLKASLTGKIDMAKINEHIDRLYAIDRNVIDEIKKAESILCSDYLEVNSGGT